MIRFTYRWSYYFDHPLQFIDEIYHDIRQGLEKIWQWTPIIWYDRDWDQDYMLRIWEKKLDLMAKNFEKYDLHVGRERKVRQLKTCRELIRRIRNEHYYLTGEPKMTSEPTDNPKFHRIVISDDWDWAPPLGPWRHVKTNGVVTEKYAQMYDDYMIKQDIDLLFKIMSKHMLGWWN